MASYERVRNIDDEIEEIYWIMVQGFYQRIISQFEFIPLALPVALFPCQPLNVFAVDRIIEFISPLPNQGWLWYSTDAIRQAVGVLLKLTHKMTLW